MNLKTSKGRHFYISHLYFENDHIHISTNTLISIIHCACAHKSTRIRWDTAQTILFINSVTFEVILCDYDNGWRNTVRFHVRDPTGELQVRLLIRRVETSLIVHFINLHQFIYGDNWMARIPLGTGERDDDQYWNKKKLNLGLMQ